MRDDRRVWREGDTIVLRDVFRGQIWTTRPGTVASVRDGLTAVYLAPGSVWKVPADTPRNRLLDRMRDGWRLADYQWTGARMLYLLRPGVAHAVHLWWEPPDWRFRGWYINLQEPIRPVRFGFDSMDHLLDVVIDRDLSWRWKDEDELKAAVNVGLWTADQAEAIRGEARRVIRQLEARQPPFSEGWERWQPDRNWRIPVLPADWDDAGA